MTKSGVLVTLCTYFLCVLVLVYGQCPEVPSGFTAAPSGAAKAYLHLPWKVSMFFGRRTCREYGAQLFMAKTQTDFDDAKAASFIGHLKGFWQAVYYHGPLPMDPVTPSQASTWMKWVDGSSFVYDSPLMDQGYGIRADLVYNQDSSCFRNTDRDKWQLKNVACHIKQHAICQFDCNNIHTEPTCANGKPIPEKYMYEETIGKYYYAEKNLYSFVDALKICQSHGTILVEPKTVEEDELLVFYNYNLGIHLWTGIMNTDRINCNDNGCLNQLHFVSDLSPLSANVFSKPLQVTNNDACLVMTDNGLQDISCSNFTASPACELSCDIDYTIPQANFVSLFDDEVYLPSSQLSTLTYEDARDDCADNNSVIVMFQSAEKWKALSIWTSYMSAPVWVGLFNPSLASCTDAGCNGLLKWRDGSAYTHNPAVGFTSVSANGNSRFMTISADMTTVSSAASDSTEANFVCQPGGCAMVPENFVTAVSGDSKAYRADKGIARKNMHWARRSCRLAGSQLYMGRTQREHDDALAVAILGRMDRVWQGVFYQGPKPAATITPTLANTYMKWIDETPFVYDSVVMDQGYGISDPSTIDDGSTCFTNSHNDYFQLIATECGKRQWTICQYDCNNPYINPNCSNDRPIPSTFKYESVAGKYYKVFTSAKGYIDMVNACYTKGGTVMEPKTSEEAQLLLMFSYNVGLNMWSSIVNTRRVTCNGAACDSQLEIYSDGSTLLPGLVDRPLLMSSGEACTKVTQNGYEDASCAELNAYVCEFSCTEDYPTQPPGFVATLGTSYFNSTSEVTYTQAAADCAANGALVTMFKMQQMWQALSIWTSYKSAPLWVGLLNPNLVTCSDSGCDGLLEWRDGTLYIHNPAVGFTSVSANANSQYMVISSDMTTCSSAASDSATAHYICNIACAGTLPNSVPQTTNTYDATLEYVSGMTVS